MFEVEEKKKITISPSPILFPSSLSTCTHSILALFIARNGTDQIASPPADPLALALSRPYTSPTSHAHPENPSTPHASWTR